MASRSLRRLSFGREPKCEPSVCRASSLLLNDLVLAGFCVTEQIGPRRELPSWTERHVTDSDERTRDQSVGVRAPKHRSKLHVVSSDTPVAAKTLGSWIWTSSKKGSRRLGCVNGN